jgi:hypothetical protein
MQVVQTQSLKLGRPPFDSGCSKQGESLMARSLSSYYGQAKHGFGDIDPHEMTQLGQDLMIAGAIGAALGLASSAIGGLDKDIFGISVPLDGVAAAALGYSGLTMGGETGEMLKVAAIAAVGSAAVRTSEKFFKKGFGVTGEFDDSQAFSLPEHAGSWGFGQSAQDRLVQAAKYL